MYDKINTFIKEIEVKEKDNYRFLYNLSIYIESLKLEDPFYIIDYLIRNTLVLKRLKELVNKKTFDAKDIPYKNDMLELILNIYCEKNNISFITHNEEEASKFADLDILNLYLKDIGNTSILTNKEEQELIIKIKKGDKEAKDKFLKANLRFVVFVANKNKGKGLSFLDLIQEGNLGLMKAIENFDDSKGYRFSTYSYWWINNKMQRAITRANEIRYPDGYNDKVKKYFMVKSNLKNELGRNPTVKELAEKLDCKESMIEDIMSNVNEVVSYNILIGEEEDTELIEFLPSDLNTEEESINNVYMDDIINFLKGFLSPKEYDIISLRLGLDGSSPKTLEEIGKIYGVTRERIRQLEKRIIKLTSGSKKLKKLFELEDEKKEIHKPKELTFNDRVLMFLKTDGIEKYINSNYKFPDNISMPSWFKHNEEKIKNSRNEKCKQIWKTYKQINNNDYTPACTYVEILPNSYSYAKTLVKK